MDKVDFEGYFDSKAEYRENIWYLEGTYPQYKWKIEKTFIDRYHEEYQILEDIARFVKAESPTVEEMNCFLKRRKINRSILQTSELQCVLFSLETNTWIYIPENDIAKLTLWRTS